MRELEVFVNDPFDASLLKGLFTNQEDLKLASPTSVYPFNEKEWEETFNRHPENCSLLFYLEGTIIGHTSFLPNDEDLYLCYVILHPDYRNKGHSQQMIKLSEEFCRLNYPHTELFLHVNRGNEKARKLYLKLGYLMTEEFETRYRMKKVL